MKAKQNSQNNNYKETVTTSNKQKDIFIKLGLISFGLLLGLSITFIIKSKNDIRHSFSFHKSDDKEIKNKSKKVKSSDYKFLNPFVLTSVYSKIYNQELANFKIQVEKYCATAKKDKSIEIISVYFRDMTNGFWFGVNEKEKFVPASLVKVPIMIATLLKAEKDPDYLNKKLTYKGSFTDSFLKQHPEIDDIRSPMEVNESYTVEQLLDYSITKSDNESALLLYNDIGQENWNVLENRLGKKVPIAAPTNLNILTAVNYSSFFRILFNASLLNREYSEKALELLSRAEYDKGIRLAIPANIRVCHKYGERDTVVGPTEIQIRQLHHAGIIYYPGKPFLICIMIKGKNKPLMQKIIYDISKIIYSEVDRQVKNYHKIENDIN